MRCESEEERFLVRPGDYFSELGMEEIFGVGVEAMEVDLGCGDGSFLIALAEAYPERWFLGVERLMGRARKVARRARLAGLENVRVLRLESSYTLGWLLPSASVSRLHFLFPDPWPKKKHHKNRLFLSEDFRRGLERTLVAGGEFLFKSDHSEYFAEAVLAMDGLDFLERGEWDAGMVYPETDFERLWLSEGKVIERACWVRK